MPSASARTAITPCDARTDDALLKPLGSFKSRLPSRTEEDVGATGFELAGGEEGTMRAGGGVLLTGGGIGVGELDAEADDEDGRAGVDDAAVELGTASTPPTPGRLAGWPGKVRTGRSMFAARHVRTSASSVCCALV